MTQPTLSTNLPPVRYLEVKATEPAKQNLPVIMSTTYPLNNSGSKKITVGLQPQYNNRFEPVVKLAGNYSHRTVIFNQSEWVGFKTHLTTIRQYFATKQAGPAQTIHLGNYMISFSTSYGMKSITITPANQPMSAERVVWGASVQQGLATPEKRESSLNAIVMQKPSFDGLFNMTTCVDERFRRLQRFSGDVTKCLSDIAMSLHTQIPGQQSTGFTDADAERYILENIYKFKDATRASCVNPAFVEHYFDIVFFEIASMCKKTLLTELRNLDQMMRVGSTLQYNSG